MALTVGCGVVRFFFGFFLVLTSVMERPPSRMSSFALVAAGLELTPLRPLVDRLGFGRCLEPRLGPAAAGFRSAARSSTDH